MYTKPGYCTLLYTAVIIITIIIQLFSDTHRHIRKDNLVGGLGGSVSKYSTIMYNEYWLQVDKGACLFLSALVSASVFFNKEQEQNGELDN